jgi:hypothetical protein
MWGREIPTLKVTLNKEQLNLIDPSEIADSGAMSKENVHTNDTKYVTHITLDLQTHPTVSML